MKLYFLRHGIAADAGEFGGSDFDRPLTKQGRDKMAREAKAIAKLDLGLEVILTSPLVRARETAEFVADELGLKNHLVTDARLDPGFDKGRLLEMLQEHPDSEALMVVGHEPSMSTTLSELIGGGSIELKKGGLACVELTDRSLSRAVLQWLIHPKILI